MVFKYNLLSLCTLRSNTCGHIISVNFNPYIHKEQLINYEIFLIGFLWTITHE